MFSGGRKRRKENDSEMDEFDKILVKFVKVTEECETKKRLLEAELEEKRRAEERNTRGTNDDHDDDLYFSQLLDPAAQCQTSHLFHQHLSNCVTNLAPSKNSSPILTKTIDSEWYFNFPSEL